MGDNHEKTLKKWICINECRRGYKKLDILIEEDKILEIAEEINTDEEIFDMTDKLIMPGFINTHSHLAMSLFRGIGDDLLLQDWLFNEMFPREDLLNDELTYYGSLVSILEMLAKGVTTVVDMYLL